MAWTLASESDDVIPEIKKTVDVSGDKSSEPEGLGQVVQDVSKGMKRGISKAKIKISLKADMKFDPEDAGVWVDSVEGVEMGIKIQDTARDHGWEGPVIADPEDEQFFEATGLAQDFLNTLAPPDFKFGYDNEGNWGLFDEAVSLEELPEGSGGRPTKLVQDAPTEETNEAEPPPAEGQQSKNVPTPERTVASIKVKAEEFSEENAGPMFEAARGVAIGADIQNLAQKYGWDEAVVTDSNDETYYSQSKSAEDFMQTLAPAGFYFGMSEEGDWGLWKLEPEGEVEVAAPKFASLFKRAQDEPPYAAPSGMRWLRKGGQWTLVSDTEAQTMTAKKVLDRVTIASEFRDELYPIKASMIDVGDVVYIRPIRVLGNVLRVKGDAYRVEVKVPDLEHPGQQKTLINTYWANELEPRNVNA